MPEPRLDYGEMFGGTPKVSAIDPELFQYDEELRKKQEAEELVPTATPAVVDYSKGFVPPVLPAAQKPVSGINWMDMVKGFSPVVGKMGAELMGGDRTTAGRIGNAFSGASQSMLLNENLRKMLQQYISGKDKSELGFQNDQQFGISDLAAAGLTPEQLGGIYQTTLKTRESERKWPLERMGALADIHNKIIMGNYHEAQIPFMQAQLNKLKMETELMPTKTMAEIMEKQVTMKKIIADTQRLELESKYKLPAEIGKIQAETEYSKAGIPLRQAEAWEKFPQGIGYKSFMETVGKNTTDKYLEIPLGNKTVVYNPVSKQVVAEFNTGQKPGEAGKLPQAHSESFARFLAMSDFTEVAAKDLMARYPKEEQQKAYQAMQDLRDLMKDQRTADMAFPALRGSLSDKNKKLFDQALDVYMKTTSTGGSITDAGERVREIISGKGFTTTPSPTPGTRPTIPQSKLGEPESSIKKKGILPLEDIGPAVMQQFNGRTKESGNPVKVSEIKQFVFDTFAKSKGVSREVSDAFVDKQLLSKGK